MGIKGSESGEGVKTVKAIFKTYTPAVSLHEQGYFGIQRLIGTQLLQERVRTFIEIYNEQLIASGKAMPITTPPLKISCGYIMIRHIKWSSSG